MSLRTSLLCSVVGAVSITILLAASASAQKIKASGVQHGDCKSAFETVVGPNAGAAQAMWAQSVAAKHGNKWAIWVGAKDKTLTPLAGGANPPFQARAKPCFYHPVP